MHGQTGERLQKCHQVLVAVFIMNIFLIFTFPLISLQHMLTSLLYRPACEVSEKMECVENTVSQCSFETRLGSTGEEEQVEVG